MGERLIHQSLNEETESAEKTEEVLKMKEAEEKRLDEETIIMFHRFADSQRMTRRKRRRRTKRKRLLVVHAILQRQYITTLMLSTTPLTSTIVRAVETQNESRQWVVG